MKENRDNIYIYVWEDLNTIYIGRTVNPKGRHYQHKHRETESTYKFSSEHHVEHPKMIIIENDLTLEEGVEREKYWIEYYKKNNTYEVLNKSYGGQIGGQLKPLTLTESERKERNRLYKKRYYENHKNEIDFKEKNKNYRTKYYENHKEQIIEKTKIYHKKHEKELKQYYKEYMKKYHDEHKKEKKEYDKKRYELHKEEKNEYTKKYAKEHREKILSKKEKRKKLSKK